MKLEHYKCIACESQDFEFLDNNSYFFVSTLECMGCTLRQSEWVSPEAIKYYYQNYYRGIMPTEAVEYFQKEYIETADYQFPFIQEHLSEVENALDYGCATGELADRLRLISKNVDVTEYDPNYLLVLKRKNYLAKSDEDLLKADLKYDLITCSHVMEHFQNPYELLNRFKSITHEGSYVYIEVPDEYMSVKASGYAKGHLTFFNIPSLQLFLSKQKNFDLIKIYDISINKYGNPCKYIGIILKRNSCNEDTKIVQQDLQKIAALYSSKLVCAVHSLKAHQKLMKENGVAINISWRMPLVNE